MATSGEIAEILSSELGMTKGAVQYYAQALRNAGMLSKGGRGLAAAHMSIEDVCNWLLALCISETAATAAAEVKLTRAAILDEKASTIATDVTHGLSVSDAKSAGAAI